ncbi:MAG TPA: diaminopimelate epimerase [Verrucomicrobiae bacterium]|nr:diaminopimelate epimerase [Verrucomicrobiae bacterium]
MRFLVGFAGMVLEFTKMNGAGNDFVLIDNRARKIQLSREQVVRLCHRQRGIGADGLFLLVPSSKADWAWEFYNSDGSVADMCGNGARCFARFIQKVAGANGKTSFETGAGIITATFQGERVTVNLTQPKHLSLSEKVAGMLIHSLNTGVPHAVIFVPDADKAMVQQLGAEIRYHPHFAPQGTNVNFAQVLGSNHIRVRTYERGVEGETLACGTGVTASALIASRVHGFKAPVKVTVQGGDVLEVDFREAGGEFTDVQLTGPAEFVYDGRIEV